MKSQSIFFVVATMAKVNFILRSGLLELLQKRGYQIVVVSPFSDEPWFKQEFGAKGFYLEKFYSKGRMSRIINNLRGEALKIQHPELQQTAKIYAYLKRRYLSQKAEKNIERTKIFLRLIPERLRGSPVWWDSVERLLIHRRAYRKLFKKYQPKAAVVEDPGTDLSIYCARNRVPVVFVDLNLDAFTTRFISHFRPLAAIGVTSKIMREEVRSFHQLAENKIAVTGMLRTDFYFKNFKPISREDFFKTIGADPRKKLVTFGAKTPLLFPHNGDIIRDLINAARENRFGVPVQIFVRFDPNHDPADYPELLPHLLFERSEEKPHREHIANLLYHSDVVISVSSSFSNEACLVNTPTMWIGFDGDTRYEKYEDSYRISYDIPMIQRLLKTKGIPLVESKDEMLGLVKEYLTDSSIHSEERQNFIKQEYEVIDGSVAERTARLIEKVIHEKDSS